MSVSKFKTGDAFSKFFDNDPPFMYERGQWYFQYDSLRIKQEAKFAIVEFWWQGEMIGTLELRCDFSDGQTLNLVHIAGRVGFNVLCT